MGGAIAVRVAAEQIIPSLIGLAIIDVVEGRLSMCTFSGCQYDGLLMLLHTICFQFVTLLNVYGIQYNICVLL